jgi:hypothetical protein
VWIKASDELPMPNNEVFLKGCRLHRGFLRSDLEDYVHLYPVSVFGEIPNAITEWQKNNKELEKVEWLKPIKQVYVLTENELVQFATDFLLDTTGEGFLHNAGKLAKEFLKSITK